MTPDYLFEKVKKLLELSASPNEHEAALAFQRAQAIIQKYSLNMGRPDVKPSIEHLKITAPKNPSLRKIFPYICQYVGRPYGVYVLVNNDNNVDLVGFPTNNKIAEYAILCIVNWGLIDYRAAYAKIRTISFGESFWQGFLEGVRKRFTITEEQKPGLIVYDPVANYMKQFTGFYKPDIMQDTRFTQLGETSATHAPINPGVQESTFKGGLLN